MLYLEDYLEIIDNLRSQLCDRLTSLRELDLQVNNETDELNDRMIKFFETAAFTDSENREKEFVQLKQEYNKTLEIAEEKIVLANQLYELVDKYLRRLDHELLKFKVELEADNAGITEILEKRSLELDSINLNLREKRKSTAHHSVDKQNIGSEKLSNEGGDDINSMNNFPSSKRKNLSTVLSLDQPNVFSFFDTKLNSLEKIGSNHKTSFSGQNAIAAAASQAIAATQQLSFGRRTASLKASYEAFNPNLQQFNSIRFDDDTNLMSSQNTNGILRKVRMKRNKSNKQYGGLDISNSNSNSASSHTINSDNNEELYCICNCVSYGNMIFCENSQCPYKWFHYECVGIQVPPDGNWYCPECSKYFNKKEKKQ